MPMSKFRYQRREAPSRNKAILGVGWWFHRCENVNLINLRRKPFLCATSEVAQGRCDWPVTGGEHWNFYENKHLCYMIYFSHSFWMTLYCPSKYFTFAWCDWQTSWLCTTIALSLNRPVCLLPNKSFRWWHYSYFKYQQFVCSVFFFSQVQIIKRVETKIGTKQVILVFI